MKNRNNSFLPMIIMGLVGALCGMTVILTPEINSLSEKGPNGLFLTIIITVAAVLAALFIQSVIHEFGHLIFGLMTGYSFTSFRIGRIMLINENSEYKIKIYNMVGTGGQCLMMPPPWKDGIPYRLYNFGGCIMNLIFSVIFILLYYQEENVYLSVFYIVLALVGFATALLNGIPMQTGGISNDGRNAMLLGKDSESLRAFWLQLYVNGLIARGERMKNFPEEWFFLPTEKGLNDSIICTVGMFRYNYFYDCHEFEKAEETAEYMLKAPGLLPLHRNELLCELLFLRVFRGAEKEKIDSLLTPELNKYIKATSTYVSRKRLAFAYFYLYKKQYDYAYKCLKEFEKTCSTYPYSSEIQNEREIVELIKQKGEETTTLEDTDIK